MNGFLKSNHLRVAAVAVPFISLMLVGCESASTEDGSGSLSSDGSARPNIVFILADDLGYGDVGCYGQTKIRTPHIDQLASEGMRFTDFYSGATVCSPSRSVLLTGQHTGHTRIRGNMAVAGGLVGRKGTREVRRMHLKSEDQTVGDVLRESGYRTGAIGKWHVGGFNPSAGPLDRGFDEFSGWLIREPGTYASTYFPPQRVYDRELSVLPQNADGKQGYYHPDMCMDEAGKFLKANRDKPFFLYLALNLPHSPYEVPDFGPYADEDWPDAMKHYAAMIHRTDVAVGQVREMLDELGLDDRTIIIFTSDNGPRSEPKPVQTEIVDFFDSNGPLRGYKRDLSDGGIRVPMIVRWPGRVAADSESATAWYFADLLPTLAAIAGAGTPDEIDGVSVLPTLLGQRQNLADRFLYWEDFEGGFEQAVRWRNWKGFVPVTGDLQLFNLSEDIGERNNVAAEHPEVVARIKDYLATARTESESWPLNRD